MRKVSSFSSLILHTSVPVKLEFVVFLDLFVFLFVACCPTSSNVYSPVLHLTPFVIYSPPLSIHLHPIFHSPPFDVHSPPLDVHTPPFDVHSPPFDISSLLSIHLHLIFIHLCCTFTSIPRLFTFIRRSFTSIHLLHKLMSMSLKGSYRSMLKFVFWRCLLFNCCL